MNLEVSRIDVAAAQKRAERIRYHAMHANEAVQAVQKLIHEARDMNDHVTLGYPSWPAYLVDLFGKEPLRLTRDVRRELVAEMSEAGMSTRAIAPIVGVNAETVRRDIAGAANVAPDPEPESDPSPESIEVDTETGEVIDAPRIEEHTVTEKTKVTTGLDGKEYKRPEPKAKPKVLEGDALADYDARQNTRAVADALQTLDLLTSQAHRDRVVNVWWPRAARNEEVPPWGRDLYQPEPIRQIAQALNSLANELENQS